MNPKRVYNGDHAVSGLGRRAGASGLSLVELMIALLIGTILLIGLVQIFSASREAYRLSEGLSRVQENSRFALDYMQRDIRMAGHWGCVNDQAMTQSEKFYANGFYQMHLKSATEPALNFSQSIDVFEADNSAPGDTVAIGATGAGTWSPTIPAYLSSLSPAPTAGSDIIVIRYLSAQGVPVTEVGPDLIKTDATKWSVLTQEGVATPSLFGISDCTYLDVFQGSGVTAGSLTVSAGGMNATGFDPSSRYSASEESTRSTLYRAEVIAYYVSSNANVNEGEPTLYRARFQASGGALASTSEPLVEGIENIQLIYGQDESADLSDLTGRITRYVTGNSIMTQEQSLRIGAVKLAVLARSRERASVSDQNTLEGLGTRFTVPTDGRYRAVYETTIAVRNRLYGN
ncbi:MAG: PilW family protein [Xanthomonadaceae bacterium]|jgi:type IV pilus assembly protein PilW|nr:PilW family protein [Xanthomonadaceae bacterium]